MENDQLLLNVTYVLRLALQLFTQPLKCLWSRVYGYTHFPDEVTKAQGS